LSYINDRGAFDSRKQVRLKKVERVNCFTDDAEISYNKRKKRMLNDLIRKLDITGSTDRTSASGHSGSSRIRKYQEGDRPFWLNKDVLKSMVYTLQ